MSILTNAGRANVYAENQRPIWTIPPLRAAMALITARVSSSVLAAL